MIMNGDRYKQLRLEIVNRIKDNSLSSVDWYLSEIVKQYGFHSALLLVGGIMNTLRDDEENRNKFLQLLTDRCQEPEIPV